MIEQVKSWGFVIQRYILSFCHYISFYIKRLGLLTTSLSHDEDSSVNLNRHVSSRRLIGDSDRKQNVLNATSYLKPSSQIPGVKCKPLVGTLFEFNKYGSRRVHELAKARHASYGDIFREKIFSQELVFVASTDLLKEWMSQEGKLPVSLKQEPSLVFAECCPYLKRGLFFRNGEDWYKLRKMGHTIVNKNASEFDSNGLFNSCEAFIEGYMRDLQETVRKSENGLLPDWEIRSYEVAVGALLAVVYGGNATKLKELTGTDYYTLSRNAKELNEHHQHLLETSSKLAKLFKSPNWTGYYAKLRHNLTTCIKFGQMLREEILKSPEEASMRTHGLLYKTIGMNAALEDIDDLLTDFAVDTKDPFAATLMFVVHVLGMCPEAQDKIYEELALVCPFNQPITHAKSKHLVYTEAFFKEVIRLYPVAAFTARVAIEDTTLGGYNIKPGTMIMYSSYVAQRDPRYFSQPMKVIPERWLSTDSKSTCDPNAFAPFGLKGRACLGQHLATSIFVMFIANLVRNFRLTSSEFPESVMQTVLYPVNPKPIHFQIR